MDIEDLDEYDFSEKGLVRVVKTFLNWYSLNKRDLPWRKIPQDKQLHAYRVWVSEIMAQQTRISTVIDYYKKWMKKFPSVESLSKADLKEVNASWSGLGYYSRAKNLWKSAQLVMNEFNGEIPSDLKDLQRLPGIGRYTAGAISSIVFGQQTPVVDGNVKRVLSRLQGINLSEGSKREKLFWKLANDLATCGSNTCPGDLNQSLMEFGALVCTPKSPRCAKCPFYGKKKKQKLCTAFTSFRSGEIEGVEIYPIKKKKKKKKVPLEERVVCVIEREKEEEEDEEEEEPIKKKKIHDSTRWIVRQRPKKGVTLAGLYEFPNYPKTQKDIDVIEEEEEEERKEMSLKKEFGVFCDGFLAEYAIQIDRNQGYFCGSLLHKFSHLHQKFSVYRILCDDRLEKLIDTKCEELVETNLEWMGKSKFAKSAVSTLTKKILKEREKGGEGVKVSSKRKRQQKISVMFKKKKKDDDEEEEEEIKRTKKKRKLD